MSAIRSIVSSRPEDPEALRQLLRKTGAEAEKADPAHPAESSAGAAALAERPVAPIESGESGESGAHSSNAGVMTGNFVRLESSRSKYVEANLAAFGQKTLAETLQDQNVTALILEATSYFENIDDGDEKNYAAKYLACRKVEKMMVRKHRAKEQEAGEEALEEIKDERERISKEAAAPKDANGEPILVGPEAAEAPIPASPENSPGSSSFTPAAPVPGATVPGASVPGLAAPEAASASKPLPEQAPAPVTLTGGNLKITV